MYRWHSTWMMLFGTLILSGRPAHGASFEYAAKLPDADGIQREVEFKGYLDPTSLRGTVTVEGNEMTVRGTIAPDGAVRGSVFLRSGQPLGTFQGTPDATGDLRISYSLGGRTGVSPLPKEIATAVRSAALQSEPASTPAKE